jgi:CHAT domain-containing protein
VGLSNLSSASIAIIGWRFFGTIIRVCIRVLPLYTGTAEPTCIHRLLLKGFLFIRKKRIFGSNYKLLFVNLLAIMIPARLTYSFLFALFFSLGAHAQSWVQKYDSLFTAGERFSENYEYDQAKTPFSAAYKLALQQRDSSKAFTALEKLGRSYLGNDEFKEALDFFLQLDLEYLEILVPSEKGRLKNLIGYTYNSLGQRDNAFGYYLDGLEVMSSKDDSTVYAQLYRNLGYGSQYYDDYEQAIAYTDSAIKYTPKKDLPSLSRAYRSKYVSYLWLGKTKEAEPFLLESWRLAEEAQSRSSLKELYLYLGDYYNRQNDVNKALIFYQKGLRLAEESHDNSEVAKYQFLIGGIYLTLKNPDRALTYFNSAHTYYESVGNEFLDAEALMKVGQSFKEKEDYEQAEQILLRSLEVFKKLDRPSYQGSALLHLVDLNFETGNQAQALVYLNQIKQIADDLDEFWLNKNAQQRTFRFDEEYVSDAEKLSLSRSYYKTALTLFPNEELDALMRLSKSYHDSQMDSSYYFADQAFDKIEERRISFTDGTLKAGLFARYASFYNEVGSWYAQERQDYQTAFELFESSKARALMDQLVEAEQQNLEISQEERMRLLQVQKTIDQLYRKKESLNSQEEQISINEEISRSELEYDALIEEIRRNNPAWSKFAYPDVLSLSELQDMTDKKTAIIEYAFTYDGLAIMVITRNEVHFILNDDNGDIKNDIEKQVEAFRNTLTSADPGNPLSPKSVPLYKLLFAPLEQYMSGIEKLVIVPDRSITLLPFDALTDTNGDYLVERFAIKMMPSVSVFELLPNPHRKTNNELLALAGSGFEAGDGLFSSEIQTAFAALPYTLIEVDSISANFDDSKVLRNEEVTEAALKNLNLNDYKYIHFATHGAINESAPSQSGLILSKKIQMENLFGEDGYLNATEISSLKLNADIVVLSSCNTATGRILTGEGLLGLQRAFLTAGASSVVASLWSIYDRSTPIFMSHFYKNLKEYEEEELGLINRFMIWADWYEPELVDYKTLALRDAKLDMLEHPYYNHPVHWASFVITGK